MLKAKKLRIFLTKYIKINKFVCEYDCVRYGLVYIGNSF